MDVKKISLKDNTLTLSVSGKVNATNSDDFYRQIVAFMEECPQMSICLDCRGLDYISSMGLRSLLHVKKKRNLSMINVSAGVYEILDVTGFTRIIPVERVMREISLEGCSEIARGSNGIVYQLKEEDSVVKVYSEGTGLDVIRRECERATVALENGIMTAISYDVVMAGNRYGVVFERISSECLSTRIKNHPEEYDKYIHSYVDLLKAIHETHTSEPCFEPIKNIYMEAISECASYYTPEETEKLRELIRSIPDRDTLLHGDYHAHNIMFMNGELLLIDMGDLGIGHPIFDLLATAATQVNLVRLNPAFAEMHTGMPVEYITRMWKDLLRYYFPDLSEAQLEERDRQIVLFSKLKVGLCPYFAKGIDESVVNASVQDAKENFLPYIDELIRTEWDY